MPCSLGFSSKHTPGKGAPALPQMERGQETLEIILLKVCLSLSRKKNVAGCGRI